jgi:hypothetical protein
VRQAINENPVAQAAVIGLLVIAVAFLFMTRVMSSNSEGDATEPTTAGSVAADPAPSAATPPEAAGATDAQAPAPAAGAAAAGDFTAGPGLPASVVDAYDAGDAVVLLVTRKAGIEDKRLRAMVGRARSVRDVSVFTTNAHGIAKYSRIAEGVDVSRVPALVVIRPRKLNDGIPQASVSYGFRGPASVEQAVRDALYEGKSNLPYYPE